MLQVKDQLRPVHWPYGKLRFEPKIQVSILKLLKQLLVCLACQFEPISKVGIVGILRSSVTDSNLDEASVELTLHQARNAWLAIALYLLLFINKAGVRWEIEQGCYSHIDRNFYFYSYRFKCQKFIWDIGF